MLVEEPRDGFLEKRWMLVEEVDVGRRGFTDGCW
jgi:hypothetical protein